MSTSAPIIITVPPTRPTTGNSQSAAEPAFDTVYDKARAVIAEAEANNTSIWFRDGTEEPQT